MPLVLIESPNKISKLKKILGSNYVIMASVGHIMDLSKKNLGVELDNFKATYKINKDKKDIPYVVVQHKETGKAFALSRGYTLMSSNVPLTVIRWVIANNVQAQEGWMPSMDSQLPTWTRGMDENEFVAYWIDYDKKYQELVVADGG